MKYQFVLFSICFSGIAATAQNVGIGTTVPSFPFTIHKDGIGLSQESSGGVGQIGFYTSGGFSYLQTHDNTDMQFSTNNGAPQLTLQKGTGNLGINQLAPSQKLDVNGNVNITGTIKINGGSPAAGKILTTDASGLASWQNPPVVNLQTEFNAYDLSTNIQGSEVDFPQTNIAVPVAGTYLINYYLDAYNTYYLTCISGCPGTPKIYGTYARIYNKTTNAQYQQMKIDFVEDDESDVNATQVATLQCPAHQISGSVVKTLNANDLIGFKMLSSADAGATAQIRITQSTVTLVRLY